jgi:hypothetical protein
VKNSIKRQEKLLNLSISIQLTNLSSFSDVISEPIVKREGEAVSLIIFRMGRASFARIKKEF